MIFSKNLIPSFTGAVVLFIVFVSLIPATIKWVFALFLISFLLPNFREIMFENKLRKFKVAFYTSIIFTLGFTIFLEPLLFISFDFSNLFWLLLIFFYCSIGIFSYGIPSSIIAELVSRRSSRFRTLISGIIHIGMGLFTGVIGIYSDMIEPGFYAISTICSVIFFLLDELTRRKI
ncbi:hypothetical protein [Cytobacillus firmus]|uniref:hypothetical protein n=1 Tax=Cytobacillus firmus TaxID=1399 RepID=UPI0021626AB5|nr:hypothetical protein [Cytobacillus firmus]MCS0673444.1 hypothetical protein [Cytobacillus firmus]